MTRDPDLQRRILQSMALGTAPLLATLDLRAFAQGVISQLATVLDGDGSGLACELSASGCTVVAAAGRLAPWQGLTLAQLPAGAFTDLLQRAAAQCSPVLADDGALALYLPRDDEQALIVVLPCTPPQPPEREGLGLWAAHLSALLLQRHRLARLHHSAYEDPLVRLPNRTRFVEQVDEAVRHGALDHTLALVDIDDFSATNDVMGHPFGDRLLEAVARRLADSLPPGVRLARVGADTFGLFGPSAQIHPDELLRRHQPTLAVDGVQHSVSLSCGHVRVSGETQTGAELLNDATIALQRAKRDHRGQPVQYLAAMGSEARDRARMVADLRASLDKAQFFLVFQPQIDLNDGALTGFEALLRWHREDGRVVPPNEFIPVAEHSGLILALGQWVLEQACRTMRTLLDSACAPRRMAVNVSVAQLRDPGFVDTVRAALAQAGLQDRHLELEITESVVLMPTQLLDHTLQTLRADGISIAIDDFGTGYSSLSYLERLPLDRLKIDRSFVRQLGAPGGARIAELVAQLGRRMGLQIVAEGIEDAQTLQMLRAMGCHEGQGFHIARPMAQAELMRWLRERQG